MNLDWMLSHKTRLEVIARYSGDTKSVDDLDVRVTRDLHCWVGAVSWSKLTGDFQINLGLKAFPSMQANFGSSRGVDFQSDTGSFE